MAEISWLPLWRRQRFFPSSLCPDYMWSPCNLLSNEYQEQGGCSVYCIRPKNCFTLPLTFIHKPTKKKRWSGNIACFLEGSSSNLGWYSDYTKQGFCGFSHFLPAKKAKTKLSLFKSCGHITGPEVQLHSLTLALDGNEWSIWCSGCFTASKITSRYPLNRRLDILGNRKTSGPCIEQNPRAAQLAQQSQYQLCYSLSGKCQDSVGMDILFDSRGSNHISLCIHSILYTNVHWHYSEQCCFVTVSSHSCQQVMF